MAQYIYSIVTDFTSSVDDIVAINRLTVEIDEGLGVAVESCTVVGDVVTLDLSDSIDQGTLDAIVAAHSGEPMEQNYDYPISSFINQMLDSDRLQQEIAASAITIQMVRITIKLSVVSIWFSQELTATQKTVLDGLVSVHTGEAIPKAIQTLPLSEYGKLQVEISKPTGGGSIRVSHDYCKPTTWYGDSIRVTDEVLGCPTENGIHFRADFKNWINLSHGLVTEEDSIINDTETWPNGPFNVVVTVNDVPKVEGVDYTVDYIHGEVAFSWPNPFNCDYSLGMGALQSNDVVKATYSRATGSTWYLRPAPGKILLIANTELQFSQNNIMSAPFIFSAWFNYPGVGMIPVPGEETIYKQMTDLVNEGNKGTGSIPAMGGSDRGLRYPVSVFPFDYLASKPLASSLSAELRTWIKNDIPVNGEYGTVTCYCMEIDDPNYVP